MSRQSKRLEFPGSHGLPLAARLDLPDSIPRAYALFAHCFTCSKDVLAAARISRALTDFHIAVFRFDFTGLGQSGGDFANTNFSSNIEDLSHAANFLRENYAAPSLLIGHSLGGAAVLAVTHRIPEVRAVATIGAPADPDHIIHLLLESRAEIEERGEAEVQLAGRTFRIRQQFFDDIATQPLAERIRTLGAALLVMHSPVDTTVDADNARRIYDTARHPKSFVALDGADHLLTKPADATFAAGMLATWASRYAFDPLPVPVAVSPVVGPAEGLVVVSESGTGTFAQNITIGQHRLTADEPEPIGTNTGPSPYDLLLAGLGACTSMTVRMYAERKKWPLEKVTVMLRHSRIHAQDCADCESETGQVDRIERVIRLDGDLDDSQRQRLREIAEKCPVHRTLHSEVIIDTIVSPPAENNSHE
ncbi:MAG: bifunctional alpha/beta hydrolase/OsmC family protein [Cryobacterium sp.]|uniref:bifunctional alpha/beta hydrolase/OsmC family protein n=1 Tax=unclassified Cryobacterium TaxID=2649013 RepID=UPI0018C92835|nr:MULTISPECIES: bifunctional alpha/beta hydrolase/OsmC family protein [unclassified Cryobacterium]MCY7403503.1 bifunctional alpha/beta hydrolase/OsmC family protein [Cryobacterium sp.]MEC5155359.1 putative OsmC-like protein/pimeloyl-ACP methyl ester carboxylesterase [Cryobacterium sp. CAN_C3]